MSSILAVLAGIAAGVVHACATPDHLAGIAPFSVEARRRAWLVGVRWGVGHAGGIIAVGLLAYGLRDWLDLGLWAGWGEALAGAVLVAIGLWGFRHARGAQLHREWLEESGGAHLHTTAAFVVGTVHGVAGTGSVLGVSPVLALPGWADAAVYLTGFGLGTVVAMAVLAALVGLAGRGAAERGASAYRWIFRGASGAALGLGLVWIALAALGIGVHRPG